MVRIRYSKTLKGGKFYIVPFENYVNKSLDLRIYKCNHKYEDQVHYIL